MKIGIMGALPQEVSLLLPEMTGRVDEESAGRCYSIGQLDGHEAVVVCSRWAKVAAASTATTLLVRYGVDLIVFTGVAGGIDPDLSVGDVVIGTDCVQHDVDASAIPVFERYQVPFSEKLFPTSPEYAEKACAAAETFLRDSLCAAVPEQSRSAFGITNPRAVKGLIATGDQFIKIDDTARGERHREIVSSLRATFPDVRAVEMEGSAVGQVTHEHSVPFVLIRTISDRTDGTADVDFERFANDIAGPFTCGIVAQLLRDL